MLYARLQVSCPSKGGDKTGLPSNTHTQQVEPDHQHRTSSLIQGRLSVLGSCVDQYLFDTVQLRLRGIIISSIGGDTAVEDIITLTDFRANTDFVLSTPSCPEDNNAPNTRHVDFYFVLPTHVTTADGVSRSIPLSTKISGTTSKNTCPRGGGGLNPGHQQQHNDIHGDCEISYWIEAQFRLAGCEVGFLCKHIKISASSFLYPRLCASLALPKCPSPSPSPFLTLRAKPHLLSRCCRLFLQKSPSLKVSLYEPDMAIKQNHDSKRRLTIPLALTIDNTTTTSSSSSQSATLDNRQSFKCSVVAKWIVHTRFSTIPIPLDGISRDRAVSTCAYKTSTASSQKCNILFRPLPAYPGEADQRGRGCSYTATSQLDLAVPDTVSQPSLRWTHLSRTYRLQLSMEFYGVYGVPRYRVNTTEVPVAVVSDTSSMDTMDGNGDGVNKCDEDNAQKGEGEGDVFANDCEVAEVEEESIWEGSTVCLASGGSGGGGEGEGGGGREEVMGQKRRLTAARTPPPAYFR
ncbi:hypothetical protein ABEF95_014733 [Exophiala dermatitidis]